MTSGFEHTNDGANDISAADARVIEAQAVEWLIARDEQQTWTGEDQKRLDAWLEESPAHMTAFWRVEAGWNRTELIADIGPFGLAAYRSKPRGLPWLGVFRVEAALAVFALIGIGSYFYFAQPNVETFTTPVGGQRVLTLFDGSRIELNTNSELQISSNHRQVALIRGEAYFQIHHDADHPFTVSVAGHKVTDLGTEFAIRTQGDALRVALVEGSARLESGTGASAQAAILVAGDVAQATPASLTVTKESAQMLREELAWRKGILVFDNTPLTEAAAEFNRYNATKIIVAHPDAAEMKLNGAIHAGDAPEFVRLAKNLFGLHAETRGNEIIIGSPDAK